jgi:transcriptional regulator with XRE-family HTH domain
MRDVDAPREALMTAADLIRSARHAARLTQRQLAARSGVAQPAIARLEAGRTNPGFDMVGRLLRSCGFTLDIRSLSESERAAGIDRTAIRELLRLKPSERLRTAVSDANNLDHLLRSARVVGRGEREAPAPR